MDIAVVETGGDPGHAPARAAYESAGFTVLPIARYFRLLNLSADLYLRYVDSVKITVTEVNSAPMLGAIGNKAAKENEALTFTLTASDPNDTPPNHLTFSATGLPTGATLNAATGAFAWTPAAGQRGEHRLTFTVTDDGLPNLTDAETITITVEGVAAPLALGNVEISNGQIKFTWTPQASRHYRVQFKTSLSDPEWIDLPEPAVPGEFSDNVSAQGRKFYRVRLVP